MLSETLQSKNGSRLIRTLGPCNMLQRLFGRALSGLVLRCNDCLSFCDPAVVLDTAGLLLWAQLHRTFSLIWPPLEHCDEVLKCVMYVVQ